jgi:hypothetical protein
MKFRSCCSAVERFISILPFPKDVLHFIEEREGSEREVSIRIGILIQGCCDASV